MNGANVRMSGASSATNGNAFADGGLKRTAEAWECFTAGEDAVDGVRPEILSSAVGPMFVRAGALLPVVGHAVDYPTK